MSPFWRKLGRSDASGPRQEPRRLRPGVTALEGRALQAILMGATPPNVPALKPIVVDPHFLYPSDGRYAPVSIAGGITSIYTMTFEGKYNLFPKPSYAANQLAGLPLPDPTKTQPPPSSGSYEVNAAGSKTPQTVTYTLKAGSNSTAGTFAVTLPGFQYPMDVAYVWQGATTDTSKGYYLVATKTMPVSPYEMTVINQRLNSRLGPGKAVLQVTDQYRQDEPNMAVTLAQYAPSIISINTLQVFPQVPTKYREQIYIPTGMFISRYYSYNFQTHLQALAHAGTEGRNYILNVSAVDADDGGSVNVAAIVPASTRK